jgi:hypothetical protein
MNSVLLTLILRGGDTLVLEEWDSSNPKTRKPTGRIIEKTATYVRKFSFDEFKQIEEMKEEGFYIIQFE